MDAISATLYGLRGAPPSMAAQLMLEHKGIGYRRADLFPTRHARKLGKLGFPESTAPALQLNGRRVQTSRAIARALDELVAEPPLFPADGAARNAVAEAERFGDEVLQPAARRIVLWTFHTEPESAAADPRLGSAYPRWLPKPAALRARLLKRAIAYWRVAERVEEDLERMPSVLDRIDGFVADGVLNGPTLNAADFEIGPQICALMALRNHGPAIAQRPASALAERVLPAPQASAGHAGGRAGEARGVPAS